MVSRVPEGSLCEAAVGGGRRTGAPLYAAFSGVVVPYMLYHYRCVGEGASFLSVFFVFFSFSFGLCVASMGKCSQVHKRGWCAWVGQIGAMVGVGWNCCGAGRGVLAR